MKPPTSPPSDALAEQARAGFVRAVALGLAGVAESVSQYLLAQLEKPATPDTANVLRDTYHLFAKAAPVWVQHSGARLRATLAAQPATGEQPKPRAAPGKSDPLFELSLLGEDAMEHQILVARLALVMSDKSAEAFNELRLRLQHLDQTDDLPEDDTVRSRTVAAALLDAWGDAGLTQEHWLCCLPGLHPALTKVVAGAYTHANGLLVSAGVLPSIDLRGLVKRAPVAQHFAAPAATASASTVEAAPTGARDAPVQGQGTASGWPTSVATPTSLRENDAPTRLMQFLATQLPQSAQWLQGLAQAVAPLSASGALSTGGHTGPQMGTQLGAQMGSPGSLSPAMAQGTATAIAELSAVNWSNLAAGLATLQANTRAIKAAASNDQEKAIIEVVALIFDSILSEERIPDRIRVWFARLQMPVLRLAIQDPTFITTQDHPARQLIDRMGSCVLGFDPGVSMEPLEAEVKRIVQVIEQYPETGRQVFEMMYKEFQAFLSKHLPAQKALEGVVNMAQQVQLKETLTVKYTIELRKLLGDVPVRTAVREFLFQVWAEVLALAAVRYGAQAPRSMALRQVAADLLWASSAKPSRHERAQVIAKVPALLNQLRAGMDLLGHPRERQDATLKEISDALADAFMQRSEPIAEQWLADLGMQLESLEALLPDSAADFELNRDSVEMIAGVDATHITVLPDGDKPAAPQALAAARRLKIGAWFDLEHNAHPALVQLAWQSEHQQLFLFATSAEQSYLMQLGRVAAYLQAGLLRPCETEALTSRASRNALEKLDANPERLLA